MSIPCLLDRPVWGAYLWARPIKLDTRLVIWCSEIISQYDDQRLWFRYVDISVDGCMPFSLWMGWQFRTAIAKIACSVTSTRMESARRTGYKYCQGVHQYMDFNLDKKETQGESFQNNSEDKTSVWKWVARRKCVHTKNEVNLCNDVLVICWFDLQTKRFSEEYLNHLVDLRWRPSLTEKSACESVQRNIGPLVLMLNRGQRSIGPFLLPLYDFQSFLNAIQTTHYLIHWQAWAQREFPESFPPRIALPMLWCEQMEYDNWSLYACNL